MNVQCLKDKLNLEVVCPGAGLNAEINGCFATDLLSLAMGNVEKDNIWVTVQTNMNILGIAALAETSCVIIANGMSIPDAVVQKAHDEGICLLKTELPVYELCLEIGKLI